jgi:D-alanine-D-alanine ligase
MAKLRIGIAHGPEEVLAPPKGKKGARRRSAGQEIVAALERAGHETFPVPVEGTPESLRALAQVQADLVFNLVESFGDDDTKEPHVAAYLELLGLRLTGSGPRGLTVAMDKALTKKVLAFHGIPTPRFATVHRGRLDEGAHDVEFPVIVKPVREDGSIGIGFDAVAANIRELMARIDQLHAAFDHPVLIEQYVEGREVYVGVLGNDQPEAFPPVELDLSHLPRGTPRIAGAEVKWAEGTRAYRGSKLVVPALPEEVGAAMRSAAVTAFQALGLRDYARFDFRLTPGGAVTMIEANPNPHLLSSAEFMRGARASGRTAPATILEIVELAQTRYPARA